MYDHFDAAIQATKMVIGGQYFNSNIERQIKALAVDLINQNRIDDLDEPVNDDLVELADLNDESAEYGDYTGD